MKINIELRPLPTGISASTGKLSYEQVLWIFDGHPYALIDIDALYTVNGNDIYNGLVKGETVDVTADFEIVPDLPDILSDPYNDSMADHNSPWLQED